MQPKCSSPFSQQPDICPYPEPDQSSPFVPWIYLRFILLLYCHLGLGLPSGIFPSASPTKFRYAFPLSHKRYMPCFLILLDFITWTIPSEDCQSRRSVFCHFLQSPVMSHLNPTQAHISSSITYSSIASAYFLLSISETMFHTNTKQLATLDCCIF